MVDITLQKSPTGIVLRIPDAYAFVSLDGAAPDAGGSSDSSSGDSGSTDSGASDSGASDGGSTDGGPADNGPADNGPAESDPETDPEVDTSDRRARMTVGAAVDLPNGLRGGSVLSSPAAGTALCTTDPCVPIRR